MPRIRPASLRHVAGAHPLLYVLVDILDGADDQRVADKKDLAVFLADLPREQKDHLVDIDLRQRLAVGAFLVAFFQTNAVHTGVQAVGKGLQQVGAVLLHHIVQKGHLLGHLRLRIAEAVRLKMNLQKGGRPPGTHVKRMDHVRKYGHHLAGAHRDGLAVDDDVTLSLHHHAHLHVFVAVRSKGIARPQRAPQCIVDDVFRFTQHSDRGLQRSPLLSQFPSLFVFLRPPGVVLGLFFGDDVLHARLLQTVQKFRQRCIRVHRAGRQQRNIAVDDFGAVSQLRAHRVGSNTKPVSGELSAVWSASSTIFIRFFCSSPPLLRSRSLRLKVGL